MQLKSADSSDGATNKMLCYRTHKLILLWYYGLHDFDGLSCEGFWDFSYDYISGSDVRLEEAQENLFNIKFNI